MLGVEVEQDILVPGPVRDMLELWQAHQELREARCE